MLSLVKNKIFIPIMNLLKQGVSPELLALSVALGFIIGIIPMVGVSTAICALLALALGLNIAAIQLVNYIAYPLQLILYIPFIKAGEKILKLTVSDFTINDILQLFESGFIKAVKVLWLANLQGIFIWAVIFIPASLMLYYLFRAIFRRFAPAEEEGE